MHRTLPSLMQAHQSMMAAPQSLTSMRHFSALHESLFIIPQQSSVGLHGRAFSPLSSPLTLSVSSVSIHSSVSRRALGSVTQEAPVGVREDDNGVRDSSLDNRSWTIKMLYDGDCPLCMREVDMLRERNEKYNGAIKFVDISADEYDADANNGIDFETAMGRIHAIRQNGEVLTNIAAFRALYEEVGLGWVYAITNHQPWASIADAVYDFWAKYRLPVTGRPPLAEVLEKRRQRKAESETCSIDDQRCRME